MTPTQSKPPASDARAPQIVNSNGTASVHLTLAVCDYEHVREITQGLVRADGITLTPLIFPSIEEITFRFTKSLEWDVSELSFGKYISLTSQGDAPMIAIPVFPSRVHRHSAIYVRADRGIKTAKDLEGRAVGIPEWAQTAGIYVRGMLAEDHGVDLAKIEWLQAGVNEPGRAEKVELKLPAGIRYKARPDTSLSAMLASGEVDAIISARAPEAFAPGGAVVRLFPDYRAEEERFFKKTGIFPIMHLDHHAPRGLRAASLDRHEPLQDVRRGQAPLPRPAARLHLRAHPPALGRRHRRRDRRGLRTRPLPLRHRGRAARRSRPSAATPTTRA